MITLTELERYSVHIASTLQIIFSWVPLCAIALLSIWLRHRPFQTKDSIGAWDTTHLPVRKVSGFYKWTRQVTCYQ